MHNAPALSYPVQRCAIFATFLAALLALGAGVWLTWALLSQQLGWPHAFVLLLWLTSLVLALRWWLRAPSGALVWDGQAWHWRTKQQSTPLRALLVSVDLQNWMLLQLRFSSAPDVWLCLHRSSAALHWRACRRAIFAPPAQPNRDAA